ncbi:hypothetical protein PPSIR1_22224 [Plesiocystis pacifica SIR-1]|uniref:Uncharacterized protein n=1 Tax=Plesiocystis pacifica SIR-1 TaxID=391625 RepID=A6FXU2_9BACT|nr:hypothetical protein [Plesiocystis pacifica]EDM81680.1 hypothetical protein PPSIR1_22224 [Plesiocystis pacifica SIR-1]
MPRVPIRWIFDELPPSGARRGGQAAEHAFGHGLGHFVREVCQNANDQALDSARVDFELVELEGDVLDELLSALRWPELRAHLAGAGETTTPSGRRLREFLAAMEREGKLLVLRIEDRGTVGLTGDEDGDGSHFRALCKDTLFSVKAREGAGGSYGLGKSVLWTFSGLSTVLFASELSTLPKGCRSPRVIGRAELPYHEVEGVGFTGPGWFGREVEVSGGRRAESIWAKTAQTLAERLGIAREHQYSGTTILVLGFREPALEQARSPAQIASELGREAARWFWPAMEPSFRGLELRVGGSSRASLEAEEHAELAPFVDAWRRRNQASTETKLERPGDLARVPLSVELPRGRGETRRTRGEVELIVRLADEDAPASRRLATFRGAGMVVEYRDFSGLSGLRPFHAILACGLGRAPGEASDEDRVIERFLRDAEPPGHDAWGVTPALKDGWLRGSGQVFVRLWDSVQAALRQLLAPPVEAGVEGPERLRKRFPLGRTGRASSASQTIFALRDFDARLDDEVWRFHGTITPELDARPWRVALSLHHLAEDGSHARPLAIESLTTEPPLAIVHREDTIEVAVPLGVSALALTGRSVPVEDELRHTEIGLRVVGEQGEVG